MSSRYDSGRDRGTNRGDRDRPRHDRSPPRRREGRSRSPRRDDYRDKDRDRRYGGGKSRPISTLHCHLFNLAIVRNIVVFRQGEGQTRLWTGWS